MTVNDKQSVISALAVLVIGLGVIAVLWGAFASISGDIVDDIRRDNKSLHCEMSDGYRKIDGDLVVDFQDGNWLFKNGSARNCEVK